jgi:hypothetical protein
MRLTEQTGKVYSTFPVKRLELHPDDNIGDCRGYVSVGQRKRRHSSGKSTPSEGMSSLGEEYAMQLVRVHRVW